LGFSGGLEGTFLDDTDGHGLFHVSDGESSERREFGEDFATHWLGGFHHDDGGVTVLDLGGLVFHDLTVSSVDLGHDFFEFGGDVGGVAIHDWRVTVSDFTRVVHDDDLSLEDFDLLGWVIGSVGSNVSSLDVLNGNVLNVETDVVSWNGFEHLFVVHFD